MRTDAHLPRSVPGFTPARSASSRCPSRRPRRVRFPIGQGAPAAGDGEARLEHLAIIATRIRHKHTLPNLCPCSVTAVHDVAFQHRLPHFLQEELGLVSRWRRRKCDCDCDCLDNEGIVFADDCRSFLTNATAQRRNRLHGRVRLWDRLRHGHERALGQPQPRRE